MHTGAHKALSDSVTSGLSASARKASHDFGRPMCSSNLVDNRRSVRRSPHRVATPAGADCAGSSSPDKITMSR